MITSKTELPKMDETVVWRAYPAWSHFTWLYFFSFMAGLRGLLLLKFGVSGWELWASGAAVLLVCAAVLRGWARYALTSKRVVLTNGYTGREIQALALDSVEEVTVQQGPIARLFGIGTVAIRTVGGEAVLRLRGITDPDVIKSRIQALRPAAGARERDPSGP